MKIYEAVNEPTLEELYDEKYVKVFLAGGISNCRDWQSEVIEELNKYHGLENLIIFTPRRKDFDITDPTATDKQIEWEFKYLEHMDIFTMFFCDSESVQPICMYELGRNIVRMQQRFPKDWKNRIIIAAEDGYARKDDVKTQTLLATQGEWVYHSYGNYPYHMKHYATEIKNAYDKLKI